MSNFEKIDDYLSNRLPSGEREAFEQALTGDAALREEVAMQGRIIRSVQQARAAELKTMLQRVPVPTGGWSTGQLAAGVIATGLVATSLYFFFRPEAPLPAPVEKPAPEVIVTPEPVAAEPAPKQEEPVAPAEEPKRKPAAKKETEAKPVQKPDIKVADPTEELTTTPQEEQTNAQAPELTVSKLEVITEAVDKKYPFHYMFAEGKLHLFGPFDRNLYEILEINGESHAVFLFYRENYYLLDEAKTAITPLAPIRDGQLLKKLREYRSRK